MAIYSLPDKKMIDSFELKTKNKHIGIEKKVINSTVLIVTLLNSFIIFFYIKYEALGRITAPNAETIPHKTDFILVATL